MKTLYRWLMRILREVLLCGILLWPYFILHNIEPTWENLGAFYLLWVAVWVHIGFYTKRKELKELRHFDMPHFTRETR